MRLYDVCNKDGPKGQAKEVPDPLILIAAHVDIPNQKTLVSVLRNV